MSVLYLAGLLTLAALFATVVAGAAAGGPRPEVVLTARLTGLPGPALSVSHFEARWRPYATDDAVFYPGMPRVSRLDFVHAP